MSATQTTTEGGRLSAGERSAARSASPQRRPTSSGAGAGSQRARSQSRADARDRAPRHRILLVSVAVIGLAMLSVLFLNAALSAGAFRQHDLEIQLILISEKEEALARKVQVDEAPLTIEKRARKLGMVPAASAVFLDLSTGKVLGEPVPAPSPTEIVTFGDDELTAPQEKLTGTLITQTPEPIATITVTADPSAVASPQAASPSAAAQSANPAASGQEAAQ
ncbi:MAG: hypothetical protein ACOYEV_11510 [Candidatus Nanopelagicales bacterium]